MIACSLHDATGADVSRETSRRISTFVSLLDKWQKAINLVSKSTIDEVMHRHIIDSAQLMRYCRHEDGVWLDMGSGGGFPGLVCAILAQDTHPDLAFTLVESDGRKCAFLQQAVRQLDIPVGIRNERIENLPPLGASIISARALAPLPVLLGLTDKHLSSGGQALFLKGLRHREELAACKEDWDMTVEIFPSMTSSGSAILSITGLTNVAAR